MVSKIEMTEAIMAAKFTKKISWGELSSKVGLSEVFLCSACLGSNALNAEEATKLCAELELGDDVKTMLTIFPTKGSGQTVPSDPLLYRFFEIAYVYGPTMKEIIHEKFGDGIMSAIDFSLDIEKVADPKGDRVKVTLNGKFLPYKKW